MKALPQYTLMKTKQALVLEVTKPVVASGDENMWQLKVLVPVKLGKYIKRTKRDVFMSSVSRPVVGTWITVALL